MRSLSQTPSADVTLGKKFSRGPDDPGRVVNITTSIASTSPCIESLYLPLAPPPAPAHTRLRIVLSAHTNQPQGLDHSGSSPLRSRNRRWRAKPLLGSTAGCASLNLAMQTARGSFFLQMR